MFFSLSGHSINFRLGVIIFVLFMVPMKSQAIYPADPKVDNQWYLQQVRAPQAWDIVTGSKDVIIAVIDSGVDIDHPDLIENIWINKNEIPDDGIDNDRNGYIDDINGWDFLENIPDPKAKYTVKDKDNFLGISHGTIVAGIIAAKGDNREGIAGISWDSKIMPLRVLDNNGRGTAYSVAKAIKYAVSNGADIINLSFIGTGKSSVIEKAVLDAYDAGLIIVAAAGNGTNQFKNVVVDLNKYPGAPICSASEMDDRETIIGVSSTDTLDQKSSFSNYGSKCVDLSAPGFGFYSAIVRDPIIESSRYYDGLYSGTSLSAPIVSGAAALIKSLHLNISNKEIVDILLKSTDPLAESRSEFKYSMGTGRLNIRNAVELALKRHDQTRYFRELKKFLPTAKIVISSDSSFSSEIDVYNLFEDFAIRDRTIETYPFKFSGGVYASATSVLDFNIVSVPGFGGGPQGLRFDANAKLRSINFFRDKSDRSGNSMDLAKFLGDEGKDSTVLGAGENALPIVSIYDKKGNKENEFFAYNQNYTKGIEVTAGDIDGDGIDEIITGTKKGGGPHIRIFEEDGKFISHFFGFSEDSRNGVNVATGDLNNDKRFEIIAGTKEGDLAEVRVFSSKGDRVSSFLPFGSYYYGGVSVASADVTGDGKYEIIVGSGNGLDPTVAIFDIIGKLLYKFRPFSSSDYYGGLRIKAVN